MRVAAQFHGNTRMFTQYMHCHAYLTCSNSLVCVCFNLTISIRIMLNRNSVFSCKRKSILKENIPTVSVYNYEILQIIVRVLWK